MKRPCISVKLFANHNIHAYKGILKNACPVLFNMQRCLTFQMTFKEQLVLTSIGTESLEYFFRSGNLPITFGHSFSIKVYLRLNNFFIVLQVVKIFTLLERKLIIKCYFWKSLSSSIKFCHKTFSTLPETTTKISFFDRSILLSRKFWVWMIFPKQLKHICKPHQNSNEQKSDMKQKLTTGFKQTHPE